MSGGRGTSGWGGGRRSCDGRRDVSGRRRGRGGGCSGNCGGGGGRTCRCRGRRGRRRAAGTRERETEPGQVDRLVDGDGMPDASSGVSDNDVWRGAVRRHGVTGLRVILRGGGSRGADGQHVRPLQDLLAEVLVVQCGVSRVPKWFQSVSEVQLGER